MTETGRVAIIVAIIGAVAAIGGKIIDNWQKSAAAQVVGESSSVAPVPSKLVPAAVANSPGDASLPSKPALAAVAETAQSVTVEKTGTVTGTVQPLDAAPLAETGRYYRIRFIGPEDGLVLKFGPSPALGIGEDALVGKFGTAVFELSEGLSDHAFIDRQITGYLRGTEHDPYLSRRDRAAITLEPSNDHPTPGATLVRFLPRSGAKLRIGEPFRIQADGAELRVWGRDQVTWEAIGRGSDFQLFPK